MTQEPINLKDCGARGSWQHYFKLQKAVQKELVLFGQEDNHILQVPGRHTHLRWRSSQYFRQARMNCLISLNILGTNLENGSFLG